MSDLLPDNLKSLIARREAVCFAGEEVSVLSVSAEQRDLATWIGLLKSGVQRCFDLGLPLPRRWAERQLEAIESEDADELLGASEQITAKLKGASEGEFACWLSESVGTLRVTDRSVLVAIRDLGLPIVTTNYDGLLEEVTGLAAVTWKDPAAIERILRGDDRGIIHLHGHYRQPESIVLGIRSRENLRTNEHAQAVLRAIRTMKSLLFIGFGKELGNPNFTSLLAWSRDVFSTSHYRHFRLALNPDVVEVQKLHPGSERIFVLEYGSAPSDLAPFLTNLATALPAATPSVMEEERAKPDPRVLAAGPFFGVPDSIRTKLLETWNESHGSGEGSSRVRDLLERYPEIETACLGAILRYDLILDFSPWRGFSRLLSVGLRNAESEAPPPDSPLLLCPAESSDCFRSLDVEVGDHLRSLLAEGLDITGFGAHTPASLDRLLESEPGLRVRSDGSLTVGGRPCARAPVPLDSLPTTMSLEHYRRALRVVAGRLRLPGQCMDRSLESLFVELDVAQDPLPGYAEEAGTRDEPGNQDPLQPDQSSERTHASWFGMRARPDWAVAIPGSEVLAAGRSLLLQGLTGSGKSTLMKRLASGQVRGDRLRIWIPLSRGLDEGGLPDSLAKAALRAAGLPETAQPVRTLLREAIETGNVVILLDGLDEATDAVQRRLLGIHEGLPSLHRDCQVVVSSRPLLSTVLPPGHFVLARLQGLSPDSAARFLRLNFGDASWIENLLSTLRNAPFGSEWLSSPLLAGLAGILCSRNRGIPDSTLTLYDAAVMDLLTSGAKRVHTVEPSVETAFREAADLAREMYAPSNGEPAVWVPKSRISRLSSAEILKASGLLIGGSTIRFAHSTLAEFLASRAMRDDEGAFSIHLSRYRRSSSAWLQEILPMYMAAGCTEAFEEVLRECERDESDHRMLSLPLRAVAYGGTAIEAVAQRYAARLMDLLVARFQQPSGVFGEEEVRLSECARRALRVVRGHLSSWAGTQLRALATAQGSLGNEARILAWSARVLPPGRPVEDDLHRAQAIVEALVDSGGDPRELTYFLRGCSGEVRAAAVRELVAERSSDHLERARGWLLDDDPNVVATAVRFLADDDASRPAIRSLLDGSTAPLVLSALAADLDVRPRLRSYMVSGPPFVRAAAARALADDPLSEVPIAHLLMGGPDELQASVEVLARKEGGRLLLAPVLRKLLQPRSEGWPGRRAGSSLASRYLRGLEEFTVHLCSLADDKDAEIRAEIAYMLEGLPAAAHVLHRHLSDADPRVRSSAVRSLASDPDARKLIEKCLFDPNTLVVSEAVAALERPSADQLAILKTMLRHSTDSGVRRAILSALTATQEGREHLARLFHEGDSAFRKEALAGIPAGNLWEELISMGLHDNSADVRAACLGALALRRWKSDAERSKLEMPSTDLIRALLRDPDPRVRSSAVRTFGDSAIVDEMLQDLTSDRDASVRAAAFGKVASMTQADDSVVLKGLADSEEQIQLTALGAAARLPIARERLQPFLAARRPDIRIAAAIALLNQAGALPAVRRILTDEFGNASECRRIVDALAQADRYHPLLLELLPLRTGFFAETAAGELVRNRCAEESVDRLTNRPFPNVLKALLERLPDSSRLSLLGEFYWIVRRRAAQLLHQDPRNHDLLHRKFEEESSWVRGAVAFAFARASGDSSDVVKRALAEKERNVSGGAIQGLIEGGKVSKDLLGDLLQRDDWTAVAAVRLAAPSPLARQTLERIVSSKNEDLRAQCGQVFRMFPDWRARLRSLLTSDSARLRASAVEALSDDPASTVDRVKLVSDPEPSVRAAAVSSLASTETGASVARMALLDKAQEVREAASRVLRARTPPADGLAQAFASEVPVVADWLNAFVAAPRPFDLVGPVELEGSLLRWLVKRLAWASDSGSMKSGRPFGDISPTQPPLGQASTFLVRIRMDGQRLARERFLRPCHNLAEAWRVAAHLRSPRPLTIWLACADVDFEYLVPPALAAPGTVHWGPVYYGFRLNELNCAKPASTIMPVIPIPGRRLDQEALTRLIQELGEVLLRPEPDLIPFLPLLVAHGAEAPGGIRSAAAQLLARMPTSSLTDLLSRAVAVLGSPEPEAPLAQQEAQSS